MPTDRAYWNQATLIAGSVTGRSEGINPPEPKKVSEFLDESQPNGLPCQEPAGYAAANDTVRSDRAADDSADLDVSLTFNEHEEARRIAYFLSLGEAKDDYPSMTLVRLLKIFARQPVSWLGSGFAAAHDRDALRKALRRRIFRVLDWLHGRILAEGD